MDGSDVFTRQRKREEKLSQYESYLHAKDDKENLNIGRRGFVRYAVAGIVAIGVAAAGAYYVGRHEEAVTPTQPPTITGTTESKTVEGVNRPPELPLVCERKGSPPLLVCKEAIEIWPKYINPTTEYEIRLSHNAYDPDGDPLTTTWLIDGEEVSHEPRYSTKLPEGEHLIGLRVSDGMEERSAERRVTVEPDQIYPVKPLYMRYKGVSYFCGGITPEWPNIPNPNEEEMDEQLDTIHNELGCNAIIISAGEAFEDKMIECGRMAIEKGFERIFIQPRYVNATVDETVEKISRFAKKVKTLRESSEAVVYMVGHEFQLETSIIRGGDWFTRFQNSNNGIDLDKIRYVLPRMFRRIIDICSKNYGYGISYASTPWEAYENLIPWSSPVFESVGVNTYIQDFLGWDENWWFNLLSRLKKIGKPVYSTDFGMMSFAYADKWGGWNPLHHNEGSYDEEPQVRFTYRTLKMLNRAKIDGCFWVQYNDNFDKGHGLYHPITRKRKKGFYMYKSYRLSE
jgi:hypothetical protein